MAVNVLQLTAGVIVGLFLLRVLQHLLSGRANPIAQGVLQGITYLIG